MQVFESYYPSEKRARNSPNLSQTSQPAAPVETKVLKVKPKQTKTLEMKLGSNFNSTAAYFSLAKLNKTPMVKKQLTTTP